MEFIVVGAPRSANADARSRRRWRERVSGAARERLREEGGPGPTDQDLAVLIIYFYQGETTLDVDNIAKSLLDGLKGVLFRDDQQVSELLIKPVQRWVIVDRSEPISVGRNRTHVAGRFRFCLCACRSGARPQQDPMSADPYFV